MGSCRLSPIMCPFRLEISIPGITRRSFASFAIFRALSILSWSVMATPSNPAFFV